MIFLVVSFFIWSLFNATLCQILMLHDIFVTRKSCLIRNLRPHKSSTLFSKASSSLSTLCSITSLCFAIVRKHFKGILWKFKIFLQFCEKNSNFLKKLRLFHFRFVFPLHIFLVSPEGPQTPKKYWLPRKLQPLRALIFLGMGLLFSGFNIIFPKLQNGHILVNKLNFEKLSQLSFLKL